MNVQGRLIVVSNRLPITVTREESGCHVRRSSGGLVSALMPAFRQHGGCWIGWPGTDQDSAIGGMLNAQSGAGCSFRPVFLDESEKRCFYYGWSNEIIWPLFHDLQSKCSFDPEYWSVYLEANEKFADVVEASATPDDFVWVHDYHLMMLANALRARGMRAKMSYFHHIPFPSPDIFEKLPWRADIVRGLLQFSSLGFQTERDVENFCASVRRCFPDAQIQSIGGRCLVAAEGHSSEAGANPISIDYQAFARDAWRPRVSHKAEAIRSMFAKSKIVLGVDRLDYTKGILERLAGFKTLLEDEPHLQGKVSLVQIVVPSRELIDQYRVLKKAIEQLVSQINGMFGRPGWTPITYWHRNVSRAELLALYRAADVALVTPLKDGMNLVAKEFCAARSDEEGILILSEFAGAAVELKDGALLVNPYDSKGMAAVLSEALHMEPMMRKIRMQAMRHVIQEADVFHWCRAIWRQAGFPQGRVGISLLPAKTEELSARAV